VNGPYVSLLPLFGKYAATVCNSTQHGMHITTVSKIVIHHIALVFRPVFIFILVFTGQLAYLCTVPVSTGNCALASNNHDDVEGIALFVSFQVAVMPVALLSALSV